MAEAPQTGLPCFMFVAIVLLACTVATEPGTAAGDETTVDTGILDLTQEYIDAPEGGIEIRTPDFEIPPYTEALRCYFGTYTGPTIGVTYVQTLESEYSHHSQLKAAPADDPHQDGDLIDCESTDLMSVYVPLFEAAGEVKKGEEYDGNWLHLPEGIGMKLRSGQRWVLDMHYVNTTDRPILVNNGVNLDFMAEDEVSQWAAAMQFDNGGVRVEAASSLDDSFTCPFQVDMDIFSLLGHMHTRGTSYAMDYNSADGETTRVYDIPEWDGGYHPSNPLIINYDLGEFKVKAGESLTTSCSFYNETDVTLEFPDEMCTTVLVVTPLEDPASCIRGTYF